MFVKSSLLENINSVRHGFGSASEEVPGIFADHWDRDCPVWNQVHEVRVVRIESPGQECGDADALFTFEKKLPVAVVTADCVPILLAHRQGLGVAAVHAGWRGTQKRILRALWQELERQGHKPSDWVAAVGPSIGPCCYEVSEELAEKFKSDFPKVEGAVPKYRYLDLARINAAELKEIGLRDVQILRNCTRCSGLPSQPIFHSYRREGGGTRQFSVIEML